jgi:hypothetical protein
MAVAQKKKSRARERHERVAEQFRRWLEKNPKAGRRLKSTTLDMISDVEFMKDYT